MSRQKFQVQLIVTPRSGVRDPQGEAVEESLRAMGYEGLRVQCVGRTLRMLLEDESESGARARAEEMCKRLLVNPNLETYEISVTPSGA